METTKGVIGYYRPPSRVKVYNPNVPAIKAWLDLHFPVDLSVTATPREIEREIHAYNKSFHNVTERSIAQQLREEGRLGTFEAVEGLGLPESFGELVNFFTHPGLPYISATEPSGITIPTKKIAGQTVPAKVTEQSASKKGSEEGEKALNAWLAGVVALIKAYGLRLAEVLGGAALILFGLAVLAKGGQAPNLPKAIPV